VGEQPLPFGVDPHTGAFKGYLLWVLFALFGPSVVSMRFLSVLLGLMTLTVFYSWLVRYAGRKTAFLAVLLLSVDSAFLFYAKLDSGPIIEQLFWMGLCLWAFGKWRDHPRTRFLGVGFLSGLMGVYSHIAFGWFLVAFFVTSFLLYRDSLAYALKGKNLFVTVLGIGTILTLGGYWVLGHTEYLSLSRADLSGAWTMFERLSMKGGIVQDLFLGMSDRLHPLPGVTIRPLTDFFLIFSVFFLFCFGKKTRCVSFLGITASLMVLQMALTPGDFVLLPHRMMYAYPFLLFLGAEAVSQSLPQFQSGQRWNVSGMVKVGLLCVFVLTVGSQIGFKRQVDRTLRDTGGRGAWSDQIYALSEKILKEDWDEVICLDWGIRGPLVLLTQGRLPVREVRWERMNEATQRYTLSLLVDHATPRTLFVLYALRNPRQKSHVPMFREVASQKNRRPRLEYLLNDREGKSLYEAYTVRRSIP